MRYMGNKILPERFSHMYNYPVKVYTDGKEGNYMCKCCVCGNMFFGDKRDVVCLNCDPSIILIKILLYILPHT